MRTTVTIDDDLLAEAKVLAARGHRTVGSVLEDALREMLARHETAGRGDRPPVVLPTFHGGGPPLIDLDDREAVAEALGDNEPPW